jgi:hypothetical protein
MFPHSWSAMPALAEYVTLDINIIVIAGAIFVAIQVGFQKFYVNCAASAYPWARCGLSQFISHRR